MPRRDGTGPVGQGPMTGRKMGLCAQPLDASSLGFGRGCGMGLGRGIRKSIPCANNYLDTQSLKMQRDFLAMRLAEIEKHLPEEEK
ncbi:MAG: DUF5320 domain-containing protein [Clostridiales bacterium]|jgi:hypothetical protein|nr:DUF5320 domain-containing protein [Clostridiales bacterium]